MRVTHARPGHNHSSNQSRIQNIGLVSFIWLLIIVWCSNIMYLDLLSFCTSLIFVYILVSSLFVTSNDTHHSKEYCRFVYMKGNGFFSLYVFHLVNIMNIVMCYGMLWDPGTCESPGSYAWLCIKPYISLRLAT